MALIGYEVQAVMRIVVPLGPLRLAPGTSYGAIAQALEARYGGQAARIAAEWSERLGVTVRMSALETTPDATVGQPDTAEEEWVI